MNINGIKVDSDTETEIDNANNNILSMTANDGYFVTNAMIGETAIENC